MIPRRIAVLGGSTVHGQGDPSGGGFVARLRAWHECNSPEANRVFNLGIGGDAVREMLNRGPTEVRARRAELTILYPGLNDTRRVGSKTNPNQTEFSVAQATLQNLVRELLGIAPVLMMSSVPPDESRTTPYFGKWFFLRDDAAKMNEIVAATAEDLKLPYLPVFETWQRRPSLDSLLEDGLHCNGRGHQILFEEVKSILERAFPIPRIA